MALLCKICSKLRWLISTLLAFADSVDQDQTAQNLKSDHDFTLSDMVIVRFLRRALFIPFPNDKF